MAKQSGDKARRGALVRMMVLVLCVTAHVNFAVNSTGDLPSLYVSLALMVLVVITGGWCAHRVLESRPLTLGRMFAAGIVVAVLAAVPVVITAYGH